MAFKLVQVVSLADKAKELNGSVVAEQLDNGTFAIGIKYKNEAGIESMLYVPSKGAGSKKEFATIASVYSFCTAEKVNSFAVVSKGIVKERKSKPMSAEHKQKLMAGRKKKKK